MLVQTFFMQAIFSCSIYVNPLLFSDCQEIPSRIYWPVLTPSVTAFPLAETQ